MAAVSPYNFLGIFASWLIAFRDSNLDCDIKIGLASVGDGWNLTFSPAEDTVVFLLHPAAVVHSRC